MPSYFPVSRASCVLKILELNHNLLNSIRLNLIRLKLNRFDLHETLDFNYTKLTHKAWNQSGNKSIGSWLGVMLINSKYVSVIWCVFSLFPDQFYIQLCDAFSVTHKWSRVIDCTRARLYLMLQVFSRLEPPLWTVVYLRVGVGLR